VEIQGVTGCPVTLKLANIRNEAPHFKCNRPIEIELAAMQNLPFWVSLLLGNKMFEINANDISDVIYVNSTFRERTEGDTWRSNSNLTSDRALADLNDVIIVQAENINTSDNKQTERNHREDNNSVETAAAVNTRSGVKRRVNDVACARNVEEVSKFNDINMLTDTLTGRKE